MFHKELSSILFIYFFGFNGDFIALNKAFPTDAAFSHFQPLTLSAENIC